MDGKKDIDLTEGLTTEDFDALDALLG